MSRRKGRVIAFQALYSWELSHQPLEDLLSFSWLQKDSELIAANSGSAEGREPSEGAKEAQTFASLIITGTIQNIGPIDTLIQKYLSSNWTMDRLNKVSLAILRIGAYELKFQKDAPPGIIIDEAVDIAKAYGVDDSYKFVNAVLDNISKNEV